MLNTAGYLGTHLILMCLYDYGWLTGWVPAQLARYSKRNENYCCWIRQKCDNLLLLRYFTLKYFV